MKVKYIRQLCWILMTPLMLNAGGESLPKQIELTPVVKPVKEDLHWYVGLALSEDFVERDTCACAPGTPPLKDHRFGALVNIGWEYSSFVAFELRAFKSLESGAFTESEHYGIYLKPQYPINDIFTLYGLVGYGHTVVDYDSGTRSSHNTDNDISYGIGLSYKPSSFLGSKGLWSGWIDIQNLLRDANWMHTDLNLLSVGVSYHF